MHNTTSRTLSGEARDAILELIMKNCKYDELSWAEAMIKTDGYYRLMEVASEMMEYKHESSMPITANTRSIVGVCMSKYEVFLSYLARVSYLLSRLGWQKLESIQSRRPLSSCSMPLQGETSSALRSFLILWRPKFTFNCLVRW